MENLILFINKFLEYFILMLVIVAVAALGFIIGRFFAKRKEGKITKEDENRKENTEENTER